MMLSPSPTPDARACPAPRYVRRDEHAHGGLSPAVAIGPYAPHLGRPRAYVSDARDLDRTSGAAHGPELIGKSQ
jgi:hypothetical protein